MTNERFRSFAATKVVELEGGYVNSSSDIGGETNFGISSKFNPEINVKTLSRAEAIKFYQNHPYYMKDCEDIKSLGFRFVYVDVRVCGQRFCIITLQNILNSFVGNEYQLKPDGIWGPKTTDAVNALSDRLRVPVLQALLSLSEGIGSSQAKMTLEAQKRAGRIQYDFTNGFIKRTRERFEIAIVLEKQDEFS